MNHNVDDSECCRPQSGKRFLKMIQSLRKKLDFKGIKCPIKVEHYHKIEKQNSVSINVFGYEDENKHLIY